jgi:hypothetical protein
MSLAEAMATYANAELNLGALAAGLGISGFSGR